MVPHSSWIITPRAIWDVHDVHALNELWYYDDCKCHVSFHTVQKEIKKALCKQATALIVLHAVCSLSSDDYTDALSFYLAMKELPYNPWQISSELLEKAYGFKYHCLSDFEFW